MAAWIRVRVFTLNPKFPKHLVLQTLRRGRATQLLQVRLRMTLRCVTHRTLRR